MLMQNEVTDWNAGIERASHLRRQFKSSRDAEMPIEADVMRLARQQPTFVEDRPQARRSAQRSIFREIEMRTERASGKSPSVRRGVREGGSIRDD